MGRKSILSSKDYDGLATIWLPGHLFSLPATLAFTPSPVLRCNFPPQSLCPWHSSLCLEGSSHISPYVPPALALLLVAHEIILCAQEWINSAILCSPMHLTPLLLVCFTDKCRPLSKHHGSPAPSFPSTSHTHIFLFGMRSGTHSALAVL